jgi:GMP synthase (glutamine-hydrolysing)
MNQTIVILDFGGQYKELIARRVRECAVYSVIKHYTASVEEIKALHPIGIIFTGGPQSVYADGAPSCSREIFELGIPILGICYGAHLIAHMLGGAVGSCEKSEYGTLNATLEGESALLGGLDGVQKVLMSHTDRVKRLPEGFHITAHTDLCPVAAYENAEKGIFAVQFHPEVENTVNGLKIIHTFLYDICHATGDYNMDDYLNRQIALVRERVGEKRVLLGLSGGVDSSVCAALLSEAIGKQLICVYIDHGFMRKNETEEIERYLKSARSTSCMWTRANASSKSSRA